MDIQQDNDKQNVRTRHIDMKKSTKRLLQKQLNVE